MESSAGGFGSDPPLNGGPLDCGGRGRAGASTHAALDQTHALWQFGVLVGRVCGGRATRLALHHMLASHVEKRNDSCNIEKLPRRALEASHKAIRSKKQCRGFPLIPFKLSFADCSLAAAVAAAAYSTAG